MKFYDFQQIYKNQKLIGINQLKPIDIDLDKRRLIEWKKADKIERIANNWYWFSDKQPSQLDLFQISNRVYNPSYVSFETALSYYQLIPEQVFTIQSVSTRKTKRVEWRNYVFQWHHIQTPFFFDYSLIPFNETVFKMASPEKALIDLVYFRDDLRSIDDIESLRLNPDFMQHQFKWDTTRSLIQYFNKKRLSNLFNEMARLYLA